VPFVDWSGITALEDILEEFERRSVNVGLIGANPRVAGKLTHAQFQVRFKDVQFFDDVKTAIRFVQSSKPI
jgi:MFS superfamily sulfate permease-like transporter